MTELCLFGDLRFFTDYRLLITDLTPQPLHLTALFLRFQFPGSNRSGLAGGDPFFPDSLTVLDPLAKAL